MRDLLFLVHRIPYPPNKGDKLLSYRLLKMLSTQFRVHLGTFIDDENDWQHVDAVKAFCAETHFARLNPLAARVRSVRGFFTGEPLTLPYYRDAGLRRWVRDVVARHDIRHIVGFSSCMGQYADEFTHARRVMNFTDVDAVKWSQYAETRPWPLSWVYRRESATLMRYDRNLAARWDAGVLVSREEAELFQSLAPEAAARIYYVYNGVDYDYFSPERDYADPYGPGGPVLVFTGAMDYWANVDAVVWFANEIFPKVRAQIPDARFFIVGMRPARQVQALAQQPGVTVTGSVPDVRPYVFHARAAVATLRIARGIQNKVLEALSMARPVVATRAAAEGLPACPNQALHVADDPDGIAQHCINIIGGTIPADSGASGRRCILHNHSWEKNLARFTEFLDVNETPVPMDRS